MHFVAFAAKRLLGPHLNACDSRPEINRKITKKRDSSEATLRVDVQSGSNPPCVKIVTHDGQILDGRNRYAVCPMAGVTPELQRARPPSDWRRNRRNDRSPISNAAKKAREGEFNPIGKWPVNRNDR
jgi:hypothetical protein